MNSLISHLAIASLHQNYTPLLLSILSTFGIAYTGLFFSGTHFIKDIGIFTFTLTS